ncbi:MAG: TetR/AcrR family transcriptional regulator [Anaerolineaceae bacterium]|nr:TetR/AcrR family transcriptional regulator [Anaerolineaceae bacterium]
MSEITKHVIAETFIKLIEEKPLTEITVQEIANACQISRQAFYYHFEDIYDLIEWYLTLEAQKLLEGGRSYQTWQRGFLNLFEWAKQNRAIVNHLYNSINREQLERFLYQMAFDLVMPVVQEKQGKSKISTENLIFIVDFYKFAFVGLLQDWIGHGMKKDPNDLVDQLSVVIQGSIPYAIDRLSEH